MKTLCWFIEDTIESYHAIIYVERVFPCFVTLDMRPEGFLEVICRCRIEDAGAIERIIGEVI
jgi:hypothetical protein